MVVHPLSRGISRAPRYSGFSALLSAFGYGALTLSGRPSQAFPLAYRRFPLSVPRTPRAARFPRAHRGTPGLAYSAFARHYLRNLG